MKEILNLDSTKITEIIVDLQYKEKIFSFLKEEFFGKIAAVGRSFWGKDYIPLSREVKKIPTNVEVIVLSCDLDFDHYSVRKATLRSAFPKVKIISLIEISSEIKDMRTFKEL